MVSLDGYFEGPNHELDWHNVDAEFVDFALEQLAAADTLLFGRKTYELMAGFWPSEVTKTRDPRTAEKMNGMPKIVFSKTFGKADWENTRLMKDLTALPEGNLLMLGSNNLAVGFIEAGLLDEVRIMVNPIAIGRGHSLFIGLLQKFKLKLTNVREFRSGNVLLTYKR